MVWPDPENRRHKASLFLLLGLLCLFIFVGISAALTSEDMDDVCDLDDHILIRSNGTWHCAFFENDSISFNITVNNITYIYTEWSNFSNHWDLLDTPIDITNMGSVSFNNVNVSGMIQTDKLNVTYIYSWFTNGLLSMDGDPWYLGGVDFRVQENFSVDGESHLEHTNVSSLNVSDMTTTSTLNITGNSIYGNLYLDEFFSGPCFSYEAIQDIDDWGSFTCVDISGEGFVNSSIDTYVQDMNISIENINNSWTDFIYSDWFDQDLNTTKEVQFVGMDITADVNISGDLNVTTPALAEFYKIFVNNDAIFEQTVYFGGDTRNYIEELNDVMKWETTTAGGDGMSISLNPFVGIDIDFLGTVPQVLYSSTDDLTIGRSASPVRIFTYNISDGANTVSPTEIIDINNTAQVGYSNESLDEYISTWANESGGLWINNSRTAHYPDNINVSGESSFWDATNITKNYTNLEISPGKDYALLLNVELSDTFMQDKNGLGLIYYDQGAITGSYPAYFDLNNISKYGLYIDSDTDRNSATHAVYVDQTSTASGTDAWASYFQSTCNGICYGFQGYGYTTSLTSEDSGIGVYGFSATPKGGFATSEAFKATPTAIGGNFSKLFSYYGTAGSNLFSGGTTYFTKSNKTTELLVGAGYPLQSEWNVIVGDNEYAGSAIVEYILEVGNDTYLHGDTNLNGTINIQGNQGLSQTVSVRKGDDSGACDLVFVSGILTSTTC